MQQHATQITGTDAKAQALSWLAAQLAWERMLDALRDDEHETAKAA